MITSVDLAPEVLEDVKVFQRYFGHKKQSETIRYILFKGRQTIKKEEDL